ncbi:MAG: 4Fe-4S dicluster domain-containing protein [Deltaproteobacteria bacterium]|nr:4Fe-4S dicluster domain-containing protein [Deltaproteobacteria bacterium]
MFFSISLYIALAVFALGLIYKVSTWFRYKLGREAGAIPTSIRVTSAVKGIVSTLFSAKILVLLKAFFLDGLLQWKVLQQDFLRWFTHICIYVGFMLLLLMHALEKQIGANLFSDYSSTVNPFMFLRDFFGLMVIVGIGLGIYRRVAMKLPRLQINAMDRYTIIILAIIMLSGILLEGTKIVSYSRFQDMVDDYGDPDNREEVKALESYWVKYFSVVSPNEKSAFDPDTLAMGKEVHEMSCMGCHSRPQSAFLGYTTAKIISPVALALERANIPDLLWYIHFLACFAGLAFLPFSKMFHVFTGPLSLMTNAVMERGKSDPANIATRQIMELDACTHCCTCTLNCSAGVWYEHFSNTNILPSEKLITVKSLASGKALNEQELRDLSEGVYLCTSCNRCTVLCPVGINLQDLWTNVREVILQRGYPEMLSLSQLSFYRGLIRENGVSDDYQRPLKMAREAIVERCDLMKNQQEPLSMKKIDKDLKNSLKLSDQANTFMACFSCETCTTVCPVVANYDNPKEALGLLPHQIMHSCGLGMKDLALGSNMLWDCVTCYQCQEYCPQGVAVTDILYELKNESVKFAKQPKQ